MLLEHQTPRLLLKEQQHPLQRRNNQLLPVSHLLEEKVSPLTVLDPPSTVLPTYPGTYPGAATLAPTQAIAPAPTLAPAPTPAAPPLAPIPEATTTQNLSGRQRHDLDRNLRDRLSPNASSRSIRRQVLAANDWDLTAAHDQYTTILVRVMQGNRPPGSKSKPLSHTSSLNLTTPQPCVLAFPVRPPVMPACTLPCGQDASIFY